ncbi:putative oxidoreductase GLYR1 homolog [Trichonephila clavata]|uniref:Cytokine-like nuclear factor N-PAC n=1 Tax=Trichonephila clavata TaxID=2740835 RepID=A0A8X6KR66_TRICU|nr:putative oxidoreductase GLYR1 homolog [Trichonephila clavata]
MNPTAKRLQNKNSCMARKAQHYVFFFGSENHAWILDENIVPHSEEMLMNLTEVKSTKYVKAVNEIVEASGSVAPEPKFGKKDSDGLTRKCAARTPRQKNKLEKPEKCPQQMNLAEEASVKKLFPLRRFDGVSLVSNTLSNDTYDPVAVTQPLNDQSSVAPEHFELPPEPSLDLSRPSTTVTERNIKPTSKKIGFIGLGMMGQRIVKNLLHSGHNVSVFNQTPEKCKKFVEAGAQQFSTPADVIQNCDIVFCCLSGPGASKSVVFENGGILEGLEKCQFGGKGYVEMTPIDPATSQELAEAITKKGGKYLEASINGSRSLAEEGCLMILGAGDRELFQDSLTCFYAMSKNAFYINGVAGSGSKMNFVYSLIIGSINAALRDAVAKLEEANIPKEFFFDLISDTSGPFFTQTNVVTETLEYMQQNLNVGLNVGSDYAQPLSLASVTNELFEYSKSVYSSEHDVAVFNLRREH